MTDQTQATVMKSCSRNNICSQQNFLTNPNSPRFALGTYNRPAEAVFSVLDGEAVAGITGDAIPALACNQIYERFKCAPEREILSDGVERSLLGATHYKKTPGEYVREVSKHSQAVRRVLGGERDVVQEFISDLSLEGRLHGIHLVRPLNHDGLPSAHARLFMCDTIAGNENLVLPHHEDYSQVSAPLNAGSEFHLIKANALIAVNFYFRVEPGLGALHVFNFKPSRADRQSLGVDDYGFPYPEECVAGSDRLVIGVRTGDVAVIRGAYVHAVVSGEHATKDRLIANLFLARIGSTIVYWT